MIHEFYSQGIINFFKSFFREKLDFALKLERVDKNLTLLSRTKKVLIESQCYLRDIISRLKSMLQC